jgi:hypothetical protein
MLFSILSWLTVLQLCCHQSIVLFLKILTNLPCYRSDTCWEASESVRNEVATQRRPCFQAFVILMMMLPMLDRACRCTLIQKLILIRSTPESEGLSSGTGAQLLVSCWRGNRCTARVLCLQITSLGTDHCALTSPPCVCLQGDGTNHCLYRPFLFSFRDENAVWKISPIFCMMGTVFPPSFVSFWIVGMFVRG